jgi:hypothetical protein
MIRPPQYKHVFDLKFFHEPTWLQRLQILFGYRIVIEVKAASEWSPGRGWLGDGVPNHKRHHAVDGGNGL